MNEPAPHKLRPTCPSKIERTLRRLFRVFMICVAMVVLISWLGRFHWSLALLEHLNFHAAILLFLGALTSAIFRETWLIWFCIAVCTIAFLKIAPKSPANTIDQPANTLCVLHINLGRDDADHDSLIRLFTPTTGDPPDVICLQEFTPEREIRLRRDVTGYRWLKSIPRRDSRGVAMLQRIDASNLKEIETKVLQWLPGEQDRPTLQSRFLWDKSEITILSVHTKRPIGMHNASIQRRELKAAANHVKVMTNEVEKLLVIGDFNSTSAGHLYHDFLERAALRPSSNRIESGGTFPANWPSLFAFDIDLCAVSSNVYVHKVEVGESIDSDHRPLWVTIGK